MESTGLDRCVHGDPRVGQRGSASVEQSGLIALLAALILVSLAVAELHGPGPEQRKLGAAIARRLRCAAAEPGPCWSDPLSTAWGRSAAGWVRASAPSPTTVTGPDGSSLSPVDFRDCRSASCAVADPARLGLTTSNRRISLFVSVLDQRRLGGGVDATYWSYRPGLGWSAERRYGSAAEVRRLAGTELLETAVPRLVALETLAGRNQIRFRRGEEPPWRWNLPSAAAPVQAPDHQ